MVSKTLSELEIQKHWALLQLGAPLVTRDGTPITIESRGTFNHGAGPDFLNARITIYNHTYCGDIEIHTDEKDWFLHKHHLDPKYNNVILHVICRSSTQKVELETIIFDDFDTPLPPIADTAYGRCSDLLESIDNDTLSDTLRISGIERFKLKAEKIAYAFLKEGKELMTLRFLFDAAGYKNNRAQFYKLFQRWNRYDAQQKFEHLESILWGESGLLPDPAIKKDCHPDLNDDLCRLWRHFANIRDESLPPIIWSRLSIRPTNAPERRLAGLISILLHTDCTPLKFWNTLIQDITTPREIYRSLLENLTQHENTFSNFWNWKKKSRAPIALIGTARATDILINVVIPCLYAEAMIQNQSQRAETLIQIYSDIKIKPDNLILKQAFLNCFGPTQKHRAEKLTRNVVNQQGLIHLYLNFCEANQADCRSCKMIHPID